MRVAHVITRLIIGGAQENTVATVVGLRQKPDLEVELISGPTRGSEGSLQRTLDQHHIPITLLKDLVRPLHPYRDIVALFRLVAHFRRTTPDLVHTHSGKAGFVGRLAARMTRVPLILHTIHGPSFGRFQGAVSNLLFTQAERIAGRVTDHYIAVANAMIEQYLAAGIGCRDQYSNIPSGFELEPFLRSHNDLELRARFDLSPSDFVVGKIARLAPLKGHADLIRGWPQLIQRCPSAKLLLVGDGVLRRRLESELRSTGLLSHVRFAGLVAPEEIPRFITAMDALVHLSYREGLPRALPQALAAGRPIVAYDCDGAGEVCLDGETGFLVPAGDYSQAMKRLADLAENPALRERFGRQGQKLVLEKFSAARMVDAIYELYCRLWKSRGMS